ncbi:MAG: peptidylprolyl isomerase [Pseudomonadales bacterium]|nr:peptidylprolyl isomerase [Pseudomonadales bacterium]
MKIRLVRLALFLGMATLSSLASAKVEMLDRIIAIVDEDVILESELNERVTAVKAQLRTTGKQAPPDDILKEQIIERLIVDSLQLQMADRAGVRINDEELNQALLAIATQNKMSLPQFRDAIERDGISYVQMREQIKKELKINRVQQGIMRNRIEISEQEIRNFLASDLGNMVTADEYRLAHILIPLPDDPTPAQADAVKADADSLLARLNSGADFQSLAIERSAGQNALDGGDLGWRKVAQLPTMFADIAPEMEIGEIRGPIKSGSGYHLIKLLQKRGAEAEGQVAQTRVRHVLVQPSEIRTDQEARELAESLREEVAEGRAFDEVAKLYSDDPGSALGGGDLGWNRAGIFVPEFEQVIADADINQLSRVFKTVHGYHFLEVTGRRIEDFSEKFRMTQAENYIRNQRFDEELESWLRELREDAFVEVRI